MLTIYKGATMKLLAAIIDNQQEEIDVSAASPAITEIEIFLRHTTTHYEYAKFTTVPPRAGYIAATIVDGKVQFCLSAALTNSMQIGSLAIVILVHTTDASFADSTAIQPFQGILATIKEL